MEEVDKKLIKLERYKSIDSLDSVVLSVVDKITSRAEIGLKKYNTNMDRQDLSIVEWINHSQEELMDMLIYMEKVKQEMIKLNINK